MAAQPTPMWNDENAHHSFVALVDETERDRPVVLDELHFLPQNGRGEKFDGRRARISNAVNIAVSSLGLTKAFNRVAKAAGLDDRLFFLRGITRRSKLRDLTELPSVVCASGPPLQMLRLWNDACRAAQALNAAPPLFTTTGLDGKGNNCRAGAKASLESAGCAFKSAVTGRTGMADLRGRIRLPANDGATDNAALLRDYGRLQHALQYNRRSYTSGP